MEMRSARIRSWMLASNSQAEQHGQKTHQKLQFSSQFVLTILSAELAQLVSFVAFHILFVE
jgi:hypothetical protein